MCVSSGHTMNEWMKWLFSIFILVNFKHSFVHPFNIMINRSENKINIFRKCKLKAQSIELKRLYHSTFFVLLPTISPFHIKQKVCESLLKMVVDDDESYCHSFTTSIIQAILMEIFCFLTSVSFFLLFQKKREKEKWNACDKEEVGH